MTNLTDFSIKLLNLYATTEFVGGLKIGNFARIVTDPELKLKIIWHCQEEIRHGFLLYDFLKKAGRGITSLGVAIESIFPHFFSNSTRDELEFLIIVHLFELKAPFHYRVLSKYLNRSDFDLVADQLIKDEDFHLKWIREFIRQKKASDQEKIRVLFTKYQSAEKEGYEKYLKILLAMGSEGKKFVDLAGQLLPKQEKYQTDYLRLNFNLN